MLQAGLSTMLCVVVLAVVNVYIVQVNILKFLEKIYK